MITLWGLSVGDIFTGGECGRGRTKRVLGFRGLDIHGPGMSTSMQVEVLPDAVNDTCDTCWMELLDSDGNPPLTTLHTWGGEPRKVVPITVVSRANVQLDMFGGAL